jgi:hypothetical protein
MYQLTGLIYKIGCLKNENNEYCIDAIMPSASVTSSMSSSGSACAGLKDYVAASGCCLLEYMDVIYASMLDASQKQQALSTYKQSVKDCGLTLSPSCSPTGKEAARLVVEIQVLLGSRICCSAGWDNTLFSTAICRDVSTSAGASVQQCSAEVVVAALRRELTDKVTARLIMLSINVKTERPPPRPRRQRVPPRDQRRSQVHRPVPRRPQGGLRARPRDRLRRARRSAAVGGPPRGRGLRRAGVAGGPALGGEPRPQGVALGNIGLFHGGGVPALEGAALRIKDAGVPVVAQRVAVCALWVVVVGGGGLGQQVCFGFAFGFLIYSSSAKEAIRRSSCHDSIS